MTKIFITIPWFLPAFRAGGPIQSISNLVKEFRDEVCFYIFCSDTDLNGGALTEIRTGEWITFNAHTKVWYAAPSKISETLLKQVERVKPDILYIEGMYSWHFNIVPLIYCKAPKKIVSANGMLHPGALSQKRWKKMLYLQLFKALDFQLKVDFHASDAAEAGFIKRRLGDNVKVHVACNYPNTLSQMPLPAKRTGVLRLLSVALISPMKNILLVLQALNSTAFDVQYDIYGPIKDDGYWKLCREVIKELPPNVLVTWHGDLNPAKVQEVLGSTHVFVLPSRSENFGHAFYEALSAGRPVITSHHTPWQGLLAAKAGMNVSLETTSGLSDAIGFFASMEEEQLQEWSLGAHAYAEKKVDLEMLRKDYAAMFFGGNGDDVITGS